MDQAISDATDAGSESRGWRLKPEHAREAQGFVVSPFAHLPAAEALFLNLPGQAGGALAAGAARDRHDHGRATAVKSRPRRPSPSPGPASRRSASPAGAGQLLASPSGRACIRSTVAAAWATMRSGTVIDGGGAWSGTRRPAPGGARADARRHALHAAPLRAGRRGALPAARTRSTPCWTGGRSSSVHRRRVPPADPESRAARAFRLCRRLLPANPSRARRSSRRPARRRTPRTPGTGWPPARSCIGHPNAHDEVAPGPIVATDERRPPAPRSEPKGAPRRLSRISA